MNLILFDYSVTQVTNNPNMYNSVTAYNGDLCYTHFFFSDAQYPLEMLSLIGSIAAVDDSN